MKHFTATELANNTGDVLAAAAQSGAEIQRHGKPRFVILSVERYREILRAGDTRRAVHVDDMGEGEAADLVAALEAELRSD